MPAKRKLTMRHIRQMLRLAGSGTSSREIAVMLGVGTADIRKVLKALARTDLLILDDWGPEKLNDEQRRDLLEIVEDRYEKRSTIVTSQVPVEHWYDMIGNPTIADAVLIGSYTMHTASNCPARACESNVRSPSRKQLRLDGSIITIHSLRRPRVQLEMAGFTPESWPE